MTGGGLTVTGGAPAVGGTLLERFIALTPAQRHEFLRRIDAYAGIGPVAPAPRLSWPARFPASPGQESLWLQWRLAPGTADYSVPHCYLIRGPLDVAALAAAFDVLVARHEALRTVFAQEDRLYQVVHGRLSGVLRVVDAEGYDDALAQARRLAAVPFNLGKGPLIRARLWRFGPDEFLLAVVCHHIVLDERSSRILESDLATAYRCARQGRAQPPVPALQYADLVAADHTRDHSAGLAYWVDRLRGARGTRPPSPFDPPAVPTRRGATYELALDPAAAAAVRRLYAGRGMSAFTAVAAVLAVFLARCTGRRDLTFGTPVSGRDRPGADEVIGYFLNLVALRIGVEPGWSFDRLAEQTRHVVTEGLRHATVPFPDVVRALGRPGATLCDVLLVHLAPEQTGYGSHLDDDLAMTPVGLAPEGAICPLAVAVVETPERTLLALRYAADLYPAATIARWTGELAGLFTRIAADPGAPLIV